MSKASAFFAKENTKRQQAGPTRATVSQQERALPSPVYAGNQAMLRRLSRVPPRMQCKLEVGAVDDPLEAEADRAADHVMRMPAPPPSDSAGAAVLRRECGACKEEDEKLRKKAEGPADAGTEAPESVRRALGTQGQPLDASARDFMEPRFGRDLSRVRIHTGAQAEQSAHDVNARAYTVGQDMVFGRGQYNPASSEGRHLLAHELSHTVQQFGADGPTARREPNAPNLTAGEPGLSRAPEQADAKTKSDCETGDPVFTPGDTFRFFINTDKWKDGADAGLLDNLQQYKDDTIFVVDGFASTEGPKDFNASLSCKRALKAKALMLAAGIAESRIIHVVSHGATPGNVDDRRSVVIHPLPPPTPQQPDTKQPDTKQPDDAKKKDDANKQDTKKDDADKDQNKATDPNTPATPQADPNPRLVIQIPLTLSNFVIPVGKPGGVGDEPKGKRDPALDQSYQPNVAFGFNYAFRNDPIGPQLGAFAQLGANAPLHLGNNRPLTVSGIHTSFNGLNFQGYLQPSYVFYSHGGWSLAFQLQAGAGKTFDSEVAGVNGLTYSFQGGFQIAKDIVPNKLQIYGQLMLGWSDTKIDDPPPGVDPWQGLQKFIGFSIGIQNLQTIVEYPPKTDPDK